MVYKHFKLLQGLVFKNLLQVKCWKEEQIKVFVCHTNHNVTFNCFLSSMNPWHSTRPLLGVWRQTWTEGSTAVPYSVSKLMKWLRITLWDVLLRMAFKVFLTLQIFLQFLAKFRFWCQLKLQTNRTVIVFFSGTVWGDSPLNQ